MDLLLERKWRPPVGGLCGVVRWSPSPPSIQIAYPLLGTLQFDSLPCIHGRFLALGHG